MTPGDSRRAVGQRWQARIDRARRLEAATPAAAELLAFAAGLAEAQRALPGVFDSAPLPHAPCLAAALDREAAVAAIPALTAWLADRAPDALASAAAAMTATSASEWRQRLDAWIDADAAADPQVRFVVEAAVQPFAEIAASALAIVAANGPAGACPFCGRSPALALLREAGHGARRSLLCGLCQTEWPVSRVGCAACGETAFDALPVFTAEEFPHVRIDACERCRDYLKAIDFTRDGQAVPMVDDLATLPLDLWAQAQGYQRRRPHWLGL